MSSSLGQRCQIGHKGVLSTFRAGAIKLTPRAEISHHAAASIPIQCRRPTLQTRPALRGCSCDGLRSTPSIRAKGLHRRHFGTIPNHASNSRSIENPVEKSGSSRYTRHSRALSQGIIITGGTSGIGFAVAKQAILEGASHVRIITRDAQRGQAAIDRLRKETSAETKLDHVEAETNEYADSKLFDHDHNIATNSPTFTTIIHCAGMTQTSLLTSTRPEDITKVLSVNLESAALLSKSLLKRYMQTTMALSRQQQKPQAPTPTAMTKTSPPQSWQIINISSLLGVKGGYGSSIYAASKAGLIALTRAVALEGAEITQRYKAVAPGFRSNVVVPGYIETPMTNGETLAPNMSSLLTGWSGFSSNSREKLLAHIPAGRFGTPDEVADAVMFLLWNEYANNCVLNLDGGLSAA